ncbi:DUF3307 domain-containing protein [Desulfosporosinus fructosivorans]
MFSDYFLALLLSHLAGDFVFQNDRLCKLKTDPDLRRRMQGVSIHIVIIFLLNIMVFGAIYESIPWIVLFLVNSFHWLLDIFKSTIQAEMKICDIDSVLTSKLENTLENTSVTEKSTVIEIDAYDPVNATTSKRELEKEKVTETEKITEKITEKFLKQSPYSGHIKSKLKTIDMTVPLFFGDQVLHLISIFIAAHVLYNFDLSHYMGFYYQYVNGSVSVSESLTLMKKVLLALIYLCLVTSVANVVVKTLLGGLRKDLGADAKTGRYIGGVERILTICIILAGAWNALAALYGSKTAIRFNQAKENPDFAEYYILGTTLSALLAVIIAGAVKITFF